MVLVTGAGLPRGLDGQDPPRRGATRGRPRSGSDRARLAQILEDDGAGYLTEVAGDVTDLEATTRVMIDYRIGKVIHLAASRCRHVPPIPLWGLW